MTNANVENFKRLHPVWQVSLLSSFTIPTLFKVRFYGFSFQANDKLARFVTFPYNIEENKDFPLCFIIMSGVTEQKLYENFTIAFG